ncbi:DUF2987 domain-containing protein [Pseudoalteromonas sp. JBTF-M23]|uniref:DUF2987 domain-containing protein n=1 Tax=Pseudoalteromonas caenipelagi TaxID=2726988 RepID=A0A849V7Q8_9GAMM|nr:DUF2987 domain-containing protein [Pseudoalteromonas caenipelagi]NOU48968.1 DUF2987 domain-containing protein [Pseudoalteromonas caenipelagi]
MNKKYLAVALVLLGYFHNVSAKEFVVSYDGFYDRLKVLEKGNFEFARVNFYVVDIATLEPCTIAKGEIVTENNSAPLTYTQDAQLLLPYDKKLDKDKAVVVIEPQNPKHDCQLKFQIEADHFSANNLNKADIYQLHTEFEELLSGLSGFFISKLMGFLLPEQKGIKVAFTHPVTFDDEQVQCIQQSCTFEVNETWQDNAVMLNTPNATITIEQVTPWIVK